MKKNSTQEKKGETITRKEAIKKAGVTALAATSLLLLNTKNAAAGSVTRRTPQQP